MHREFRRLFWPCRRPCSVAQRQEDPVAKIGTETFTTLAAAFDAAKAGDTVELLDNVEVDATLRNDVAITLDLGGKTLTRAAGAEDFMLVAGADLTITNGTINGGSLKVLDIADGTVVLGDGLYVTAAINCFLKAYTGVLTIGAGCVVESRNDLLDADQESVINVYGTMKCGSPERPLMWATCQSVNVYDGAELTSSGGEVFRSNGGAAIINIYGGAISSTGGYCVFHSYNASTATKYNIYGGTVLTSGGDARASIFDIRSDAVETTVTPFDNQCSAKFSNNKGLADFCAEGYAPVKDGDWYVIAKVWDVTFYVGGVVSNAQVVVNGEYAQAFDYDNEAIDAWTNAAGVAYTEVAITENTDFFAQLKQSALPIPTEDLPADIDPADAEVLEATAANLISSGVDAAELKAATAAAKAGKTLTAAQQDIINSLLLQSDTLVEGAEVKAASIAIVNGQVTITVEGVDCTLPAKTTIGYLTVKHCETVGGDYKAVKRIEVTTGGVGTAAELDGSDAAGFYKAEFEWNKPEFEAQ